MKKFSFLIILSIVTISIFLLGFSMNNSKEPNTYYQVYLNDEILGVISSEEELNNYINNKGEAIKEKYEVDTVYAPVGLQIKKIATYNKKLDKIEDIYTKIEKKSPFTIKGYAFSIKKENENVTIYVTDASIFEEAVTETIKTFVGTNDYQAYLDGTQVAITTTGKEIRNVYVDEDITYREMNIPVTETIYTNSKDLSKYLLFGTTEDQQTYTVQVGDTIDSIAFTHEISTEEFLISNPKFTSASNLLFPGQVVTIGVTDPKISVVEESHIVEDIVSKFKVEEIKDSNLVLGQEEVRQAGVDGLDRVTENVKKVNGTIAYIDPESKEVIKESVSKIIAVGTKYVISVGRTSNWSWPTNSGWTISSGYGYRIDPFSGARSLHQGLDIAGTGYGSPVYAVANGVVHTVGYGSVNGYYVSINHNNGYWTRYMHMISWPVVSEGQTVEQGQIIGYVGSTGAATGPHLHLEVWVGQPYSSTGYSINPWLMYQ